jgi:hypothetical protein
VIAAPRQVDEVGVGAHAEHLSVPILEVAVALAELGDLGGTDEREVHGPGEQHQPLAGVAPVRDLLELAALLDVDGGLQVELGDAVSDGQHYRALLVCALGCFVFPTSDD